MSGWAYEVGHDHDVLEWARVVGLSGRPYALVHPCFSASIQARAEVVRDRFPPVWSLKLKVGVAVPASNASRDRRKSIPHLAAELRILRLQTGDAMG